ncbi:MAG: glycosyltransferase [Saprospiraceae bacterium]
MPSHDIAVIIVNYNVKAFLHFCLLSVYASTKNLNAQVIVVDNHSTDDSLEFLRAHHPKIKLISSHQNQGFAKACNIGFIASDARYILFLNPDMIIGEGCIAKCVTHFAESKNIGAIGIKLLDGKGTYLSESKRGMPNVKNTFFKQLGLNLVFPKSSFFNGYYLGHLSPHIIQEVDVLTGAFFFTTSDIFKKVDGFDNQFFMYGEDIDLSYRIQEKGYKIIYIPEPEAIHFKGESTKKTSLKYFDSFYGSMKLYVDKHYSARGRASFGIFLILGIFLSRVAHVLKKTIRTLVWPLLDTIVLCFILYTVAGLWATYFYQNPDHFQKSPLLINVVIYTTIWVSSLVFHGHYNKYASITSTATALIKGLLLILAIYALLGDALRSSRAVILLGFGLIMVILPLLKLILIRFFYKKRNNDVWVDKEDNLLNDVLKRIGLKPSKNKNSFSKLFTIGNQSYQQMISEISLANGKFQPFFWDPKHQLLISSFEKKKQGLSLEGGRLFNITKPSAVFSKRIFDILASLIGFIFIPLSYAFAKKENYYYKNLILIIKGKRTIFSYKNKTHLALYKTELPEIKCGFWPIKTQMDIEEQILQMKDYALHYSIIKDVTLLLLHLKKVMKYLSNNHDQ